MEGVSNHDRTIGEDWFAIRGRGGWGKERPNTTRTGELAEAAFLHKAVGLGLKVTKPWGDSERYDFVVDAGERLWRVQIKCTAAVRAGGYHIQPIHFVYGKKKVTYTAEDIDVLAASSGAFRRGLWANGWEGHGFSRAAQAPNERALAPGVCSCIATSLTPSIETSYRLNRTFMYLH
jgi:hypothetical protein